MTTVGIIGGLGPESTVDYYRRILEAWERDDPTTAPSIVIDSLDVQLALRLVESDRAALTEYLLASLRRLAGAGVDFAVMAANTPHIVFDDLAARSPIPLLSIVEVCAQEAQRRGLGRLGLLGTRFTMEGAFYAEVCARYGIVVVPPNGADRAWVHERYVGELLRGEFRDDTRRQFMALVSRLRDEQSIDGVILGGTELPLLLSTPIIADVPALDTTALHVAAIVKRLRQTGTLASTTNPLPAGVILLPPGDGRHYPCGPMQSLFLADGEETGDRYSVSIWYVDPGKPGPGGHSHVANEELFYVIEGTMTFLVGDEHVDATAGTFLRIPAGVMHDFENRTARRAGVLNVFIPGGFESNMPAIVEWYRAQAQPKTDTKRR